MSTLPDLLPQIDDELANRAEESLVEYLKLMWPFMDPASFIDNWHIHAIAEHLEALLENQIRHLIITVPPRCMKSLSVGVGFPSWTWGPKNKPHTKFLFSSYAASLSIRDSTKCRRVIQSPLYQEYWGDRFMLLGDQNAKQRYDNDKGGYRLATSVDGANTGEGGDIVGIDDPHNVNEGESDVKRSAAIDWWDGAMSTRLNDARTGHYLVIQQRVHQKDVAGHILARNHTDWEHLNLPMQYERSRKCRTVIGWEDPRTKEKELLWPERFPLKEVQRIATSLGTYRAAGQLQQRPAPREGGIVSVTYFRRYKTPPAREAIKRLTLSFDTAYKEEQIHDPSVCEVWAETEHGHFLLFVWVEKVKYPVLKRKAKNLILHWQPHETIIEDKASGQSLIQDLRVDTNYAIYAMQTGAQSKIVRMENEDAVIESGVVWLPEEAPWLFAFEEECQHFPNAEYDDQVDSMSQYLKRVRQRRGFNLSSIKLGVGSMTQDSNFRGQC